MKILGIRIGESYIDVKNLRYGSIMIMIDQDVDGSHIKGLIINFIHTFLNKQIKYLIHYFQKKKEKQFQLYLIIKKIMKIFIKKFLF